jgi:hypothetical protein
MRNESGQKVKRIVLEHERGTISALGVNDKEELRIIFKNEGENSYNVSVTLSNDSTLASKSVYFEQGYRGTETIKGLKL